MSEKEPTPTNNNYPFLRKLGRVAAISAVISVFATITGTRLIDYAIDNGKNEIGREINNGMGDELDGVQGDFENLLREQIEKESTELQDLVDQRFTDFEESLITKIESGELLEQILSTTTSTTIDGTLEQGLSQCLPPQAECIEP
ncbi:MAG: hypothetical protein M3P98_04585 [bacterium]|nr:hypothetical protein [bacterium]